MLQRKSASTGVVYYISPLLAEITVPHAFSTRIGGISQGPFASLNLGNPGGCSVQDDPANIRRNYQRLAEAAGLADRQLRRVRQVHGSRVVTVSRHDEPGDGPEADGLITADEACAICVRVADCVPILLSTPDGRHVAAIHAGWRGVIAGIATAAVQRLTQQAAQPAASLIAAIGPCIGIDAFEVGTEVLEQFMRTFGPDAPIIRRDDGKGHVDLRRAVQFQILSAGIAPERIDMTDRCTSRDAEEFYSHRRDHGVTGRMAALITPRP